MSFSSVQNTKQFYNAVNTAITTYPIDGDVTIVGTTSLQGGVNMGQLNATEVIVSSNPIVLDPRITITPSSITCTNFSNSNPSGYFFSESSQTTLPSTTSLNSGTGLGWDADTLGRSEFINYAQGSADGGFNFNTVSNNYTTTQIASFTLADGLSVPPQLNGHQYGFVNGVEFGLGSWGTGQQANVVLKPNGGLINAEGAGNVVPLGYSIAGDDAGEVVLIDTSSIRYKQQVQDISNTSGIYRLRPRQFAYNSTPTILNWGFVAEEAYQADPNFILRNQAGLVEAINTKAIIASLVGEIQKLRKRVDALDPAGAEPLLDIPIVEYTSADGVETDTMNINFGNPV